MSRTIEPSALWQALQDVDDGQEPADVYARVMSESIDPTVAIEEELFHEAEESHDLPECRNRELGYCPGIRCDWTAGMRVQLECECKCHEGATK